MPATMAFWDSIPAERSKTSLKIASRSFSWILPSFLSDLAQPSDTHSNRSIRPTAWLDGLRGWASLFVFFYHFNANYNSWNGLGWGYQDNRTLLTLPVIRTVIAGPGMVSLFFVVSGYSLAWGPLKEFHKGEIL